MLFLAAAATALLLSSCQRDELQGGSISGEEVSVSISATMPIDGGAVVKSGSEPGNASEVNRCIMGVYLNDDGMSSPERMGDTVVVKVDGTSHKADFGDLQLVTGHKYLLVFWADNAAGDSDSGFEDNHYSTAGFPEVTFKEGDTYQSNHDTRDAFFASYQLEVDGPSSHDIELHRPFGQLNITTNDYRTVAEDFKSLLPTQVKIDFSGIDIPTGIDLLTGELTKDDKESSLVSGPVDIANVSYPIAADGCRQLSFDYIFAPYEEEGEEQQLVLNKFKMHFLSEGQETISAYTFQNIPVRRNYRTNVSGNLLTDRTGIDVEVVPDFNGTEEIVDGKLVVETVEELSAALEAGRSVMLAEDMTLDRYIGFDSNEDEVIIDLNSRTLTFSTTGTALLADNSDVTLENGTILADHMDNSTNLAAICVQDNSTVTLDKITMETNSTAIFVYQSSTGARIEVKDSKIDATYFCIGTNATAPSAANAEIVVENSELTSDETPLLINIPCDATLTECKLNGVSQGAFVRGGNVVFSGCEITQAYEGGDYESVADRYDDTNWGSGNYAPLAGITVGNRSNDYQYPTSLTLYNTTVSASGSHADYFPAVYAYANQGEGLGVTIDYDSDCRFDGTFEVASGNVTVNGSEFAAAGQSASIGNVESLKDAIASLGTGDGKIQHLQMTLSEDITLSDSDIASGFAPAGTSVGMDLAGHTMNLDALVIADNSSIAFFDGTILTQNLSAVNRDALSVGTNGTLTLDGITLESNGSGVGVAGTTSGGRITVRNSKMNVAAYAVATNASLPYSQNVKIVLENSTFTGSDPVFVNIPADVTIKKCSMTGTVHGMILRGGNANVEDCTITLHYTDDDGGTIGDYFNNENWGTGNMLNIAGLTVGNKLPGAAYQYPSSINLVNTVVEVTGPYADNLPAMYVWANEGDDLGVTITYDGDTKFYGDRIYGNNGANITVNGALAVSDEGDARP